MAIINDKTLAQFAREKSVIIIRSAGPCPVFARGDLRTVATHWLTRDIVLKLEGNGVLARVPRGLSLSKSAETRLEQSRY